MPKSFVDSVTIMVEESDKPIKAIAEEVGKNYSTLKRELNEFDEGAKLGVELLVPLMMACESTLPLKFLADRFDFNLLRRHPQIVEGLHPISLVSAVSNFLELQQNPDASQDEISAALNKVYDLGEAIYRQRFPERVAFRRGEAGFLKLPEWVQGLLRRVA